MASDREYLYFVLDQLSDLEGITWRGMMGEYIIYHQGRIVGGIYDNRFLVKQTATSREMMPDASLEVPYEGAKEMLSVPRIDDRGFLCDLIGAMSRELLPPRKK